MDIPNMSYYYTLTSNSAIQSISIHKERFSSALSMSFKNIDGLDWVLDVAAKIDRFHSLHRIDSHRCKKIIVTSEMTNYLETVSI
jgi:hypothetical protein